MHSRSSSVSAGPPAPARRRRARWLPALGAGVLLFAAPAGCGGDDDAGTNGVGNGASEEAVLAVEISGAWARSSAAMANAGAVYLTATAESDDALVGASVDAAVAAKAELHETAPGGMDTSATTGAGMGEETGDTGGMGMGDDTGVMTMQPVGRIELPAGESVALEPGGYHVMLLDLAEPLEVGSTFTLTLEFEIAGSQEVEVEVRES